MARCRATKRFRRKGPSGKFTAGDVRCLRQEASHARPRNVRYSKPRHGGHFNGDVVEWDLTPEETEGYLARREEFIAKATAQGAEYAALKVMEKPQGVR